MSTSTCKTNRALSTLFDQAMATVERDTGIRNASRDEQCQIIIFATDIMLRQVKCIRFIVLYFIEFKLYFSS